MSARARAQKQQLNVATGYSLVVPMKKDARTNMSNSCKLALTQGRQMRGSPRTLPKGLRNNIRLTSLIYGERDEKENYNS